MVHAVFARGTGQWIGACGHEDRERWWAILDSNQ